MAELQWVIRRLVRRLQPAGIAGLVLLLLSLAIVFLAVIPMQGQVERLRRQVAAQPAHPLKLTPKLSPEQLLTADLEQYQQRFPVVDQLSDQLDTLFELADTHALLVDRGEYVLIERTGVGLRRFEVTLPVVGTYPHIRDFVLNVLDELPATALADFALERDKIAEGRGKATLKLVMFVRKHA